MTEDRSYEHLTSDARRYAPAAARNVDHIVAALGDWLPQSGTVLEVASGTGEHVVAFARRFPRLQWQPSDASADALASIAAWSVETELDNLNPALHIDVEYAGWPIVRADAIVAINMVHISAPAAAIGLLDGAARLLGKRAPLILYGPWIERGAALAPSNLAFDVDLRGRNSNWGLREVEAFEADAAIRGLELVKRRAMPANNLMLLLRRR